MSKYVIELNTVYDSGGFGEPRLLWKAEGFNTLVFDKNGIAKLQPLEDAIEEEVNHAVEKAIKDRIDIEKAKRIGFIHGLEKAVKILEAPTKNTNTPTNTPTDLISRQYILDRIEESVSKYGGRYTTDMLNMWGLFTQMISDIPSADRPTGEWVRLEREENVYDIHGVPTWGVNYMCDKCGFITTAIQDHFGQYKWCPSCGAMMKGADDD